MSNEMNGNDSDLENDIHQANENAENQNQNPAEYFKVTPDNYTDSDSNTIIDFDSDYSEEQKKIPKEEKDLNELGDEDLDKSSKSKKSQTKEQEVKTESKHEIEGHEDNQALEQNENENENENGEEQDEGEENEEEDNGITDPNVKKLMKMDLNDKKGIIDLLMKDNLVKKSEIKIDKIIKKQNMAKYDHVEPKVGKSEIGNMKTTYGRKGFQIEQEEGNPEFIRDINIAATVVKDQIEKENNDVAKDIFGKKLNKKALNKVQSRLEANDVDKSLSISEWNNS